MSAVASNHTRAIAAELHDATEALRRHITLMYLLVHDAEEGRVASECAECALRDALKVLVDLDDIEGSIERLGPEGDQVTQ